MSTNAFAKFDINHLSPSSLNLWRSHQARWIMRYLYKRKEPSTPSQIRGNAVERGMEVMLQGSFPAVALSQALALYDKQIAEMLLQLQGVIPDEVDIERNRIAPMLKRIGEWL